jgi:hypothetical protein
VSRELLDGACWRALHRQVRTERVTQHVDALLGQPGDALSATVALMTRSRVIGVPSGKQNTRSDRRCRDAFSALVSRCVMGSRRDRPPFGTVT